MASLYAMSPKFVQTWSDSSADQGRIVKLEEVFYREGHLSIPNARSRHPG